MDYWLVADNIQLNDHYFDQMSMNARRKTATHELGHALGLGHHGMSNEVMYMYSSTVTYLGTHDICSYNFRWNASGDRCGDPY